MQVQSVHNHKYAWTPSQSRATGRARRVIFLAAVGGSGEDDAVNDDAINEDAIDDDALVNKDPSDNEEDEVRKRKRTPDSSPS